jgi:hypothetical protein
MRTASHLRPFMPDGQDFAEQGMAIPLQKEQICG